MVAMWWGARSLVPSGLSAGNFLARGAFLPPPLPLRAMDPNPTAMLIT